MLNQLSGVFHRKVRSKSRGTASQPKSRELSDEGSTGGAGNDFFRERGAD